jgi:hypothetical protein
MNKLSRYTDLKYTLVVMVSALLWGCKPSLDFPNTTAINPSMVWTSQDMIQAYLTDIYGNSMPGWNFNADNGDEAMNQNSTAMSSYDAGINITVSGQGIGFNYSNIDKINFMLAQLPTIPTTVLSQQLNNYIKGQAFFWRAWAYWGYVQNVGGVPLILKPQNLSDSTTFRVKRSPTSVCVDSILADLNNAIALLPPRWSGSDYGRIDKCAAMAFKGRILLWYASPLFNRNNDQARWQAAYTANKAALDTCLAEGYALMPQFNKIWQTEGIANTEAIMFNPYYYPDHAYNMNTLLPWCMTQGNACRCLPLAWQVLAFPRIDGSSIAMGMPAGLDTARLRSDAAYNASFFTGLVKNMDPRFYASIFVPGRAFPSAQVPAGQNYWEVYQGTFPNYNDYGKYQMGSPNVGIYGGFYPLKAVTPGTNQITSQQYGSNIYIEIRFAEVLMNLAECTNEIGNTSESLGYIAQIRKRAGIIRGSGTYGYGLDTYTTQADVRNLIIQERMAEFAQEGKRWGDLRRWMRFDILNNEKYMSQLFFVANSNVPTLTSQSGFDWTQSITTDAVRSNFHLEFISNVTNNAINTYNLSTNHWFYPIALNDWQKDFNSDPAMQNNEWGGTFDPLQ